MRTKTHISTLLGEIEYLAIFKLNVLLRMCVVDKEGVNYHPKKAAEAVSGCKGWHTRPSIVLM